MQCGDRRERYKLLRLKLVDSKARVGQGPRKKFFFIGLLCTEAGSGVRVLYNTLDFLGCDVRCEVVADR